MFGPGLPFVQSMPCAVARLPPPKTRHASARNPASAASFKLHDALITNISRETVFVIRAQRPILGKSWFSRVAALFQPWVASWVAAELLQPTHPVGNHGGQVAGRKSRLLCVLVYHIPWIMSEASLRPGSTLDVPRLDTNTSFAKEAYAALKRAITAMDIYDHPQEIRLDERRLSEGLGVSRTPIREAMTLLEQEGFVRTRPRRGIFVVRKSKREIVEIITVMAALESMAARPAGQGGPPGEPGKRPRAQEGSVRG